MTNQPLTIEVSDRICNHMNKDHQETLCQYAEFYGGVRRVNQARMIEINNKSMKIEIEKKVIEINFDHELLDSNDAHKTLISMSKAIPKNQAL